VARPVAKLLVPFAGAELELLPVSRRVNRPEHDDPACIAPLETGAALETAQQLTLGDQFGR